MQEDQPHRSHQYHYFYGSTATPTTTTTTSTTDDHSFLDGEGLLSMNDNHGNESSSSSSIVSMVSIPHHRNHLNNTNNNNTNLERQPLLLRFASNNQTNHNNKSSITTKVTDDNRQRRYNTNHSTNRKNDDNDDEHNHCLMERLFHSRSHTQHQFVRMAMIVIAVSIAVILSSQSLIFRSPNYDTTTFTSTIITDSMSRIPIEQHHITSENHHPDSATAAATTTTTTTTFTPHEQKDIPWKTIPPFPHIDRQSYNDPITNFMNPSLFHDSLLSQYHQQQQQQPNTTGERTLKSSSSSSSTTTTTTRTTNDHSIRSEFIFPYPTGSFWTNFVLPVTADQNLSYPIVIYPYAYKWSDTKLVVSYPSMHQIRDQKSIHDYFFPDLSFSLFRDGNTFDSITSIVTQTNDPSLVQNIPTAITDRKIIDFDPLSITIRYYHTTTTDTSMVSTDSHQKNSKASNQNNNNNNNNWDVYLVQGSPYVTMKYTNALPYIKAFTSFTNIQCLSTTTTTHRLDDGNDKSKQQSQSTSTFMSRFDQIFNSGSGSSTQPHDSRRAASMDDDSTEVCSVTSNEGMGANSNSNTESTTEKPLYHTLHGTQFIIETQEGIRWMMFTSNTVFLTMDINQRTILSITIGTTETSSKAYTGIIRYAIIPPTEIPTNVAEAEETTIQSTTTTDEGSVMMTTGIQRLIDHASIYPISANVDWKFRTTFVSSSSSSFDESQIPSIESDVSTVAQSMGSFVTKIYQYLFGTKQQSPMTGTTTFTSIPLLSKDTGTGTSVERHRVGTIEFQYRTETFTTTTSKLSSSSTELLMLALPHHLEGLVLSQQLAKTTTTKGQILGRTMFDLVYKCIKGPMRAVIGSKWSIDVPLLSLGFDGDSGSNHEQLYLSPAVRSPILQNLQKDIKLSLPTSTGDIYGFGKQAARLAQLVHISHLYMMSDNSTTKSDDRVDDGDIAGSAYEEATTVLRTSLVQLITGKVSDRLVYDANLGGMVTSNGLTDSHADFGNGRYNDHHFHYGYLLYACAIMGKVDPTFVDEFGDYVDAIFYDIANYNNFEANNKSSKGAFFPGARHKIWYDGHSYASGMFPFGNGKSQESSSEAVNGYYGAYLWSVVRHGAANDPLSDTSLQTDFARLLLATEIRGAKMYWHMMPPNITNKTQSTTPVYTPEFSMNYMVGNIGMLDALCSTWFGNEELYVHMINFIPVTSATGELFSSSYIEQEYTNTIKPLGDVEMAWRGYVVADHAIIEPNDAWNEAELLESSMLDSALSKTQVLFWIATRSGFDASAISKPSTTTNASDGGKATCSSFATCSKLGLVGDCCPTAQGSFLECCPQ